MTDELTDIKGVGPSRAETLVEAGYDSVMVVAEADPDALGEELGASANSEAIITSAQDLVSDEEAGVDEGEETEDEDDYRSVTRPIEVETRDDSLYLVKGLLDEMLRLHGRNEFDEADEVADLTERVFDEIGQDGGTIRADLDDLSYLYTSIRNIEQEFKQTRGVTDLVGRVKDLRVNIQDARQELWPE